MVDAFCWVHNHTLSKSVPLPLDPPPLYILPSSAESATTVTIRDILLLAVVTFGLSASGGEDKTLRVGPFFCANPLCTGANAGAHASAHILADHAAIPS